MQTPLPGCLQANFRFLLPECRKILVRLSCSTRNMVSSVGSGKRCSLGNSSFTSIPLRCAKPVTYQFAAEARPSDRASADATNVKACVSRESPHRSTRVRLPAVSRFASRPAPRLPAGQRSSSEPPRSARCSRAARARSVGAPHPECLAFARKVCAWIPPLPRRAPLFRSAISPTRPAVRGCARLPFCLSVRRAASTCTKALRLL